MEVRGIGPISARLCILVDYPRASAIAKGVPLGDWELRLLEDKLRKAGIRATDVRIECLLESPRDSKERAFASFITKAANLPKCTTLVTLGESSLLVTSGHSNLDKWHCSPLDAVPELSIRKVMPTFHPQRIVQEAARGFWMDLALSKAAQELYKKEWVRKDYAFKINPPLEESLHILEGLRDKPELSVDIETGRSQINTMGFAWTERDAVAINVLPGNYSAKNYYELWRRIAVLLQGPAKKIMQNGIYEQMYLSMYGIPIENYYHDTMWCQKFLYPEMEKGLAAVGRVFTNEPFWKDEGKTVATSGGKKDWGNIRDWTSHYIYNCKDTSGTYEGYRNQVAALHERGLWEIWDTFIRKFAEPLSEMCLRGLPISEEKRRVSHDRIADEIGQLIASLTEEINPRSPKQKLELFKGKGYKIPKIRDAKTKAWKESTNELSLKKMRLKYPSDTDLKALIELSGKQKALSAYVDCTYDEDDRIRYMFDGHGTETGRFSSSSDHRGRGFNVQTIPKYAKKFIEWPEESGRIFINCDLKQAESRFVAYDAADSDLITMLEDPTKDIHKYVAAEIFKKAEADVVDSERQLGKKSGHGANYAMAATTFMESCLKEMDLVLSKKEAQNVLDSYHRLFPGIQMWHKSLRDEVRVARKLSTPMGRERYFYGRMDDNLFRESYAYRPQSTVPDITNCLMLGLWQAREDKKLPDFWFHAQVHDSILVSALESEAAPIIAYMLDIEPWHPEIILRAGRLKIPTSVEVGRNLGDTKEL